MRFPLFAALAVFLTVFSHLDAEPPRLEVKHEGPVGAVVWTADGKSLISAGQDGIVRVTDLASGKEQKRIDTRQAIKTLALSPDGKQFAIDPMTGKLSLWSLENGNMLKSGGIANYGGDHLAFLSDGSAVVSAGVGTKMIWHHDKGGASGSKQGGVLQGCAALSPDGHRSAWHIGNTGRLLLYDFDGRLWKSSTMQVTSARALAFSPDGTLLAVAAADNAIHLWDLNAKNTIRRFEGLREPATHMTFSANGKTIAAVGSIDAVVRIWDVANGRMRRQLLTNRTSVNALSLSPDGRLLATAGNDGKVLVWSVATRDLGELGPPIELGAPEVEAHWLDLASSDLTKADAAFRKLVSGGNSTVPHLAKQIRGIAMPVVDANRIDQLLKDLDSKVFAQRDLASKELAKYGELAEVPLKKLLDSNPTLETKRRVTLLFQKLKEPTLSPERLRALESLEVLEHIRSSEARKALSDIAQSSLIAQIQREANEALQRLSRSSE